MFVHLRNVPIRDFVIEKLANANASTTMEGQHAKIHFAPISAQIMAFV